MKFIIEYDNVSCCGRGGLAVMEWSDKDSLIYSVTNALTGLFRSIG